MVIFSPEEEIVAMDGATLNAPERATIDSPTQGLWFVLVYGFELYVTTE